MYANLIGQPSQTFKHRKSDKSSNDQNVFGMENQRPDFGAALAESSLLIYACVPVLPTDNTILDKYSTQICKPQHQIDGAVVFIFHYVFAYMHKEIKHG